VVFLRRQALRSLSETPLQASAAKFVTFLVGKHPIAPARFPNLFSCHWHQKTLPKWKAVISAKQQQISEAPMNMAKIYSLKSGRADRMRNPAWPDDAIIGCG
jgi:hypothetical protein